MSEWWRLVLGYTDDPDDPSEPGGHGECMISDPVSGDRIVLIEVPDGKQVKNRVHSDLVPTDRYRDGEVARLVSLGATQVAGQRLPDGRGWVALTGPEGNACCILRRPAGRAATAPPA